jgi:hypothetical protein
VNERTLFNALLQREGLDPEGFDFAMQPIRQSAELGGRMELMVTVTRRAARISRTYCSRAQDAAWATDLSDDLRAGVYGARSAP